MERFGRFRSQSLFKHLNRYTQKYVTEGNEFGPMLHSLCAPIMIFCKSVCACARVRSSSVRVVEMEAACTCGCPWCAHAICSCSYRQNVSSSLKCWKNVANSHGIKKKKSVPQLVDCKSQSHIYWQNTFFIFQQSVLMGSGIEVPRAITTLLANLAGKGFIVFYQG